MEEQNSNNPDAGKWAEQTVGCLVMEEVPTEECPCVASSGCKWFRTVIEMPAPIGDYIAITGIGGNLGNLKIYTYRNWYDIQYTKHARLEAERERSYFTKKNRRLYIEGKGQGEPVAITSPFYDPIEAQLVACDVDKCKPFLDYDVFVDAANLNVILGGVVKNIVGMKQAAGYDNTNDGNIPRGIE